MVYQGHGLSYLQLSRHKPCHAPHFPPGLDRYLRGEINQIHLQLPACLKVNRDVLPLLHLLPQPRLRNYRWLCPRLPAHLCRHRLYRRSARCCLDNIVRRSLDHWGYCVIEHLQQSQDGNISLKNFHGKCWLFVIQRIGLDF